MGSLALEIAVSADLKIQCAYSFLQLQTAPWLAYEAAELYVVAVPIKVEGVLRPKSVARTLRVVLPVQTVGVCIALC